MITWNDVIKFASKGNPEPERRVEKSDHEWKDLLTVEQYKITRLKGTEPAGTGALCHAHEAGVYSCSCCDTELFDSTIKFESGSGWPSFFDSIAPGVIELHEDRSLGVVRTEVVCAACNGHLGHLFDDAIGTPTGQRYCMNSLALEFEEQSS